MTTEELKKSLEAALKVNATLEENRKTAEAEIQRLGRVTAEQQAKLDRIDEDLIAKVETNQRLVEDLQKQIARQAAMGGGGNSRKDEFAAELTNFNIQLQSQLAMRGRIREFVPVEAEHYRTYKKAMNAYLRRGDAALDANPDFRSAMSVGSDPDGGYLVPADMTGRLVGFVYETSPLRRWANVVTTERDAKSGRYDLDEAGAEWVGEKSTRSRTSTPKRGVWKIPVHEQHANLPLTQNEIDDAGEDVEGWLARKAADKFSRAENTAFVTGSLPTRPRGFATYSHGTPAAATASAFQKIEQIATGHASSFKADPNGPDVFKDMVGALKDQYLERAAWAMKRSTLSAARKLKDSNGAYQILLEADPRTGRVGFVIESLPVAIFNDMAALGANALAIALADWLEAYEIVDRGGIRVLRDPYTAKNSGEVEIDFYKRVGGDVLNFDAIKLAKCATTV